MALEKRGGVGIEIERRLSWRSYNKRSEGIYTLWGTEHSAVKALQNVASRQLYFDQTGC